MEVFLNPADLKRAARFLGFEDTRPLLTERWITISDRRYGAPLPQIRFRTSPLSFCPFLENRLTPSGSLRGLCRLHPDHKPLVCRLAPLSRSIDLDTDREEWAFTPPMPGCPGSGSEAAWCSGAPNLSRWFPSGDLRQDLDDERDFFRRLRQAMRDGMEKTKIIESFYILPC